MYSTYEKSLSVDSVVEITDERLKTFYGQSKGKVVQVNQVGTMMTVGVVFENGRFAWICEKCVTEIREENRISIAA